MRYREVIRAPLWLLAIVYFFMLTLVISIWSALGDTSALISLALVTAASLIGDCIDLDNEAIKRVRTRDADPRAFLAIRFWTPKGVQVVINDTRDSTPYWLISSNAGAQLIKAIKN